MQPSHPLEQQIIGHWPPDSWCEVSVVVAVSGGPDSVALLRALLAIRHPGAGRLIVAHFNHGQRGEESEGDERFVREISRNWGLECEVGRAQRSREAAEALASEEAFRHARYAFLRRTAAQRGARYVVTAHTADDQAETVLHRIIRGTGLSGLRGIRRFRELFHGVALVRPLLAVRRREVLDYLAACQQPYRQDSSNRSPDYTRNRLRLDLIPRIEEQFNAALVPALTRLASLADEVQQVIDEQVESLLPRVCVQSGTGGAGGTGSGGDSVRRVVIDCRTLRQARRLLVRELMLAVWQRQGWPRQAMSYAKWEQLADMATRELAFGDRWQETLPGGVVAERTSDQLVLSRSV